MGVTAAGSFRLRVADATGAIRLLEIDSSDAAGAVRRAAQLGLTVLAIEARPLPGEAGGRRQSAFSLLLFNQELLALLEAGLHLNEALQTLLDKAGSGGGGPLRAVLSALSTGRNFSDALSDHPGAFPVVYIAIVRAAERTGDLPRALARFIAYQLQFDQIRKKLVAACIYPAMLMLVGGSVTLFLLGYVVPRFASVYVSAGREMPAASAALLAVGSFLQQHALGLVLALVASGFALALWLRRSGWAGFWDTVLRLPGVAPRAEQFRLARFYRAVGLLLAAGVPLPRALGMVDGLLAPAQRTRLRRARSLIEQGQPLTQALVTEGLASPVARSLIAVGERSGQLADMLERSARFHDEELERWLDWASRLLEPLLMILIGAVVGGVVLLLYLPIFELAGGL
ncbi:MAG: type II secretion system F family protein [Hylemonella sp.]|nr:type II secretion system F family protein [Hylemonella sp.]